MNKREYPDIEFVETDTETIENSMIALFELMYKEMTGKTKKVYPASPERLFIAWAASIVIQQRIIINETAKKNVPRYANGKYLDSLGELFKDTFRLPVQSHVPVAGSKSKRRFPLLHFGDAAAKRDCTEGDADQL